MKLPITSIDKIDPPLEGFGFAFIDEKDNRLKIKKHDSVIEYSNTLDDIQLLDLTDYTAFEVMPTKEEIPSGSVDNSTGLTYNNAIPACTIHKMSIKSTQNPNEVDVVIDWGDGEYSALRNGDYASYSNGSFELEHDYAPKMLENTEKFIIKIYGKNYWAFRHEKYQATGNNLMSRVFDSDLPLASHIVNIASTCFGAMRLLNVNFIDYYNNRILNINSLFCKCKNLVKANGLRINPK